jgi:predicted DNA-binding transcriptional regulator YafY
MPPKVRGLSSIFAVMNRDLQKRETFATVTKPIKKRKPIKIDYECRAEYEWERTVLSCLVLTDRARW